MLRARTLPSLRHDEHGFTFIEALVAMITGVIVTGALFAILEVSMHQSSRLSEAAQATQLGRTAMTHMVDELHSACLSSNFTPVLEKSTGTKLIFVTGYSEKTEFSGAAKSAEGARKDEIVWKEKEKGYGTLTDFTYLATSGTPGSGATDGFAFASPTSVQIAEKVLPIEAEVGAKKEKVVFRYFEYAKESAAGSTEASTTLSKTPMAGAVAGLTEKEADKVASVQLAFKSLPTTGTGTLGRAVEFNNQVIFAFSAPSSEATIEAFPCE